MDKKKQLTEFLFDITKEVKEFYETPVIYLTEKDYADTIFTAMCNFRRALENNSKKDIIDIIVDIHLQWLHIVNEIENYKKIVNEITKEDVSQAISYTIDAIAARFKYYQRYMNSYKSSLSNADQPNLLADLEIVEEMHKEVTQALLDKLTCFRNFTGQQEFLIKLNDSIDELLQWFDKINDSVVNKVSKYVNLHLPHLQSDLTKILHEIVDDLHTSKSPSAQKLLNEMKEKGKELGTMTRCTAGHALEISKVVEKIHVLDDRILRLQSEPTSAALSALAHKKEYLERRLTSLEKLKTTLKNLQNAADFDLDAVEGKEICVCEDFFKLRIFNHLLPSEEREKLCTKLCSLWNLAIFGEHADGTDKSIISILSAAELKEEYEDELGTFFIDEYSRKVYKLPEDETLYQPNEHNVLVPLADDPEHVYFYDACGRYYTDTRSRQRVYKACGTESEYMMDSSGILLKIKEVCDGTTFYYDNYGRYYENSEGKRIYKDIDTLSEYENDGLGNLVRIRSRMDVFEPCPDDAHVTEDFKYLKQNVGAALKICIADCILQQPADPIKYLANRLVKYRENLEIQETRSREKDELLMEREIVAAEERAAAESAAREAAMMMQGGSEASFDSNLAKYSHLDDIPSASSK